jgi:predicted amidophosphoribosyltransferase
MSLLDDYKYVCPGCYADIDYASRQCHMWYSTWHCWECGATLDSRVVYPLLVKKDWKP